MDNGADNNDIFVQQVLDTLNMLNNINFQNTNMENPIIETRQKLIDHIKNYNKDEPTIADYQALYLAITGYSNIINNIKGTEDLLNFYKDKLYLSNTAFPIALPHNI